MLTPACLQADLDTFAGARIGRLAWNRLMGLG